MFSFENYGDVVEMQESFQLNLNPSSVEFKPAFFGDSKLSKLR